MYLLSYTWRLEKTEQPVFMNRLMKEHPLEWLARTTAGDPRANCTIIWWCNLTPDEAELAKQIKFDG